MFKFALNFRFGFCVGPNVPDSWRRFVRYMLAQSESRFLLKTDGTRFSETFGFLRTTRYSSSENRVLFRFLSFTLGSAAQAAQPKQDCPQGQEITRDCPCGQEPTQDYQRVEEPTQVYTCVQESTQDYQRVEEPTQVYTCVQESTQDCPRVQESTQDCPRVQEPTQVYPCVQESTQDSPRVQEPTRDYPRVQEPTQDYLLSRDCRRLSTCYEAYTRLSTCPGA
jgi:hypothetical protein